MGQGTKKGDRVMSWRYRLESPFRYQSSLLSDVLFENEWGRIDGYSIEIAKGYSWDGCSPAWRIGSLWLGTPDGKLNPDGRPQTFYASLVHDYLCQFSRSIDIKKEVTVILFRNMLIEGGLSPLRAAIYAACVDKFGPQDWGVDADVFQYLQKGYR